MDPNRPKKLSVCMIVRNEQAMLPGCLESIRACAEEIIVVDTGSTDRSMDIARQYGAVVLEQAWANDFSSARNAALSQASGEWILSLDADERILNPEELRWVVEHAAADMHGFLVNLTSVADKNGTQSRYVSQLLRLFRNDPRICFSGRIHEQIIECFEPNGLRYLPSSIEVEHLGYNLGADAMQRKQQRNMSLLDTALRDDPHDAYMLQQRAKTSLALGNIADAERDTVEALRWAKSKGVVRPQALNYGGVIAFQLQNYDLAIARAEESLRIVPHQAFAYFVLGECYTAKQDYAMALECYQEMLNAIEKNDITARVIGAYEIQPSQLRFLIGRSALACGRQELAMSAFREGMAIDPKTVNCRIGLANCELNLSHFSAARRLLLDAQALEPTHKDIPAFLRRIDEVEAQRTMTTQQLSSTTMDASSESVTVSASTQQASHSRKPLISLCMIVKNEQHCLRECLESVKDVVDEMVIVDTGSTDKTVDIAKEFGATIGNFNWIGDFAKARNASLQLCQGEWILYMDADERLTPESAAMLRSMLLQTPAEVGAFICTIISPHRQADAESEIHRGGYPRLFRNYGYPKVEFRGRVHEQITPSLIECGAHIVNSSLVIQHTGYDIDRDRMQEKVRRNYELLIKHVQEEPLNAYAWFQLGQTLGRMNVPENSEQALKFALELGTLSTPVAASAASTLAHLYGTQQRYEEALKWCDYSLAKVPHQIMAMHYKAYALMYLYRLDEAEKLFFEVLELIENKHLSPEAGYDVDLKPAVVQQGLAKLQHMRSQPRPAYLMQE